MSDFDIGPERERLTVGGQIARLCPICGAEPRAPIRTNPRVFNTAPVWEMACIVGCIRFTARSKAAVFSRWQQRSVEAAREVLSNSGTTKRDTHHG